MSKSLPDYDDLDMENDLEYLLGLAAEALDDTEHFESDAERAEWVVAQWCQELQFVPDLRDYSTGETVPPSAEVVDLWTARYHEAKDEKTTVDDEGVSVHDVFPNDDLPPRTDASDEESR